MARLLSAVVSARWLTLLLSLLLLGIAGRPLHGRLLLLPSPLLLPLLLLLQLRLCCVQIRQLGPMHGPGGSEAQVGCQQARLPLDLLPITSGSRRACYGSIGWRRKVSDSPKVVMHASQQLAPSTHTYLVTGAKPRSLLPHPPPQALGTLPCAPRPQLLPLLRLEQAVGDAAAAVPGAAQRRVGSELLARRVAQRCACRALPAQGSSPCPAS